MSSKSRIISLTLLFSIVLSFALNAVNIKDKLMFNDGHIQVSHHQDSGSSVNEDFVFEETENDTEDFSETIYFLLPFLNFSFEVLDVKQHLVSHTPVTTSTNPLFISFRTFRI